MSAPAPLTRDLKVLAGVFVTSGVVHLVRPETFEPIMPKVVPVHREVIYASGVAELLCAAGLLHPRTRKLAGWASVVVLLAVYPANFKMAGDALQTDDQKFKAAALVRLPLQLPMIRAALRAARPAV
ncbi:MAG: rane protein [Marmoricola sp.]|nr:rane protein [Marmoricola sp.]